MLELKDIPDEVKHVVLEHGIEVQFLEVPGSPTMESGKVINPLTQHQYKIKFIGEEGQEQETTITINKQIWFQGL